MLVDTEVSKKADLCQELSYVYKAFDKQKAGAAHEKNIADKPAHFTEEADVEEKALLQEIERTRMENQEAAKKQAQIERARANEVQSERVRGSEVCKKELANRLRALKSKQQKGYGMTPMAETTLDLMFALLDEQVTVFASGEFQRRQKAIDEAARTGKTNKMKLESQKKLMELRMSIQDRILPRYGFNTGLEGVMEMVSFIPP